MDNKLPLEKELESVFIEKFPSFPEELKEGIAKYGPYVMLVVAVLGLIALLGAGGLGSVVFGLGGGSYTMGFKFYVAIVVGIITSIIYIMAFTPLKARQKKGWRMLYYGLLISLVGSLIQLQILSLIIGGVIGFWILFQVREKYS